MNTVGLISYGGTTTGNERYMLELIQALLLRDDGFQYTVFYTREEARRRITERAERGHFHKIRPENRWLRQSIGIPWAIRREKPALLHCQYGLPALTYTPSVVMLPDVYFARNPEHHPRIQRLQLEYRVPKALRAARRVIVPSVFTRDDVLSLYPVDESKIRVIPHGVSERFRPMPDHELQDARARYRLPATFVLFVGALQPRKNVLRLVQAFGGLNTDLRHAFPLLISGAERWMYAELKAAAKPFVEEGTVRFLGFADDVDLPALMNLASVFAFPSLSEGFGFPAVEAMRCGTCVLAANAGSLPELVQDGGLLVDPFDVLDIRNGLRTLLDNEALRLQLGARGLLLAQRYTWSRTAEQTARTYHEALGG